MIYSSCDIECHRVKLVIMRHFLPFYPPLKTKKNQNFEKMKKNCWRYHHFTQVYQKPQSYEVQFLRQNFLSFWVNFCHFTPLTTEKIKIKKKMKKESWDAIILHMCTKNHNHVMYASWDMEYDRHNFLSFCAIFCPFTPLLTLKIKIWNKFKENLEILSYYTSVP